MYIQSSARLLAKATTQELESYKKWLSEYKVHYQCLPSYYSLLNYRNGPQSGRYFILLSRECVPVGCPGEMVRILIGYSPSIEPEWCLAKAGMHSPKVIIDDRASLQGEPQIPIDFLII